MTNGLLSYKLPTFTGLTRHGWSDISFLRDTDHTPYTTIRQEIDAQVRSGDYFVTLATMLDSLSNSIDDHITRTHLEDIVSDLIYLQDAYTITKNKQAE